MTTFTTLNYNTNQNIFKSHIDGLCKSDLKVSVQSLASQGHPVSEHAGGHQAHRLAVHHEPLRLWDWELVSPADLLHPHLDIGPGPDPGVHWQSVFIIILGWSLDSSNRNSVTVLSKPWNINLVVVCHVGTGKCWHHCCENIQEIRLGRTRLQPLNVEVELSRPIVVSSTVVFTTPTRYRERHRKFVTRPSSRRASAVSFDGAREELWFCQISELKGSEKWSSYKYRNVGDK